jgi:hypothetical protein
MCLFFNCLLPHQIWGSSILLIAAPQKLSGCCVVIIDASKLKHTKVWMTHIAYYLYQVPWTSGNSWVIREAETREYTDTTSLCFHVKDVKETNEMMIIIFWEMTPCGSYKNRRFGGSYRLHLQGVRVQASTERVVSSCLDSEFS